MILLITAADVVTPARFTLGPLLVAAPAITAAFAGPWLTALVGTLALAGEVLIAATEHLLDAQVMKVEFGAMTLVSVFVVLFCLIRDRERRELVQLRSVAEAAQRALLRPLPERLGPLRLAHTYAAAAAEAKIGGDIYGAVRTPRGTRLIIGDARGKGLPAVSDAAILLGAFHEAARRQAALPDLVADLEDSVGFNLTQGETSAEYGEGFVTAAIVDIPDDKPLLTLVSCGHPAPLLVRGGQVTSLDYDEPAPPLGLGALGPCRYRPHSFPFEDGDLLLLYTDGVIEARDVTSTFYPLAEKIGPWGREEPATLLRLVSDDLLGHVGGRLHDDAAMIAIRRQAA